MEKNKVIKWILRSVLILYIIGSFLYALQQRIENNLNMGIIERLYQNGRKMSHDFEIERAAFQDTIKRLRADNQD